MRILKRIAYYLFWIFIALVLGVGYMRIVLGANEVTSEGLGYLFYLFYNIGLLQVGTIIGSVIAVLFILLEVCYLQKHLKNNTKSMMIRFGILLIISVCIAVIHYLLEKVIDVI